MSVRLVELQRLAQALHVSHDSAAVAAASLISLSQLVFRSYGRKHGLDLEPMVALQALCVFDWAERQGIDRRLVRAAMASLRQAGRTAEMLDRLPEGDLPRSEMEALPHLGAILGETAKSVGTNHLRGPSEADSTAFASDSCDREYRQSLPDRRRTR